MGRGRGISGSPDPVDIHVGNRVRQRRTLLGFSQQKLAAALGLTFQQVQKYERGTNRVSASRLHQIGTVLDVPVAYFFENIPKRAATQAGRAQAGLAEDREVVEWDPMLKRETLELVRAYYRIGDRATQKRLFDMIKVLGGPRPKK